MSGIIGIVSERNTVPDLLHSLQQMAQASHNSCGLVVHGRQGQTLSPPRLHRHRRAQRVSAWIEHMAQTSPHGLNGLQALVGMGHTGETAVHGPQTLQHALPHMSHGPDATLNSPARIAVVSVGQVQVSPALCDAMLERGYHVNRQCATEMLAHLIDATYQNDPVQAVRRALALISGAVAVGVMFHDQPQRLIAAHLGAPLWLSRHGHSTFVTSDHACLRHHTEQIIPLNEGDVVDIDGHQCRMTNSKGEPVACPTLLAEGAGINAIAAR